MHRREHDVVVSKVGCRVLPQAARLALFGGAHKLIMTVVPRGSHNLCVTSPPEFQWGSASDCQSGDGSPLGTVTPGGLGDIYIDRSTPELWQASGLTVDDWVRVSPYVMLSLENDDHLHTGDTDEVVVFRQTVSGGMMGNNGKLRLEFLGVNEGAGDVTFRAYFGAADSDITSATLVCSDTELTAGSMQQCVVEVANRNDVTDQSSTPDLPMNTPGAPFVAFIDCNINTEEDVDFFLTAQCADGVDGIANATNLSCIFIDPPNSVGMPWTAIWESHVHGNNKLHVSPTGLFGHRLKIKKGDKVRVSHGARKLTNPFAAGAFFRWNPDPKISAWDYVWEDANGVAEPYPLKWWYEAQAPHIQSWFKHTFPEGEGFDDPDVRWTPDMKLFLEEIATEYGGSVPPSGEGLGSTDMSGFEFEGDYGGGTVAGMAAGFVLGGLAALIFEPKSGNFPPEPKFHCAIKHRTLAWTPKDKIPGSGGFFRLRILWTAYPGWGYIVGDPVHTQETAKHTRPTVQFSMGDYSHTFTPTNAQIQSFARPDNASFGMSTMVFDVTFNLKYNPGPAVKNYVKVNASAWGSWLEPYTGPGNNPIIQQAAHSWMGGHKITSFEIDPDNPFNLNKSGWYEYYPPVNPPQTSFN